MPAHHRTVTEQRLCRGSTIPCSAALIMQPSLMLLLLLPPLFSSLHAACLAATPSYYYAAGSAHFSTPSSASNSTSAFWLSANGNLTFGFKSLGPSQYLLCIWMTADPQQIPLWWPNLANPILAQDGATLTFTTNGNLQLSEANQSVLWSTSASNASFAKLQNTGNLQLLDGTLKGILWQSFSDLRDTLIVRPRSADDDNNSTDSLSSIVVDKPYLLQSRLNDTSYAPGRFHVATDEQYSVYLHALDEAHDADFIYVYASMNVRGDAFKLSQDYRKTYRDNSSMPMSMLRLDPDGNLRIYAWNDNSSTWDRIWQFIDDTCKLGSPCGPYSICKESANGSVSCACPTGYQAVDNRSASLGCYTSNLNLSRICEVQPSANNASNGLFYMAENKQSDYYYNDLSSQQADDVEECKELCLKDCDCIAASYRSGTGTCFLKGKTRTGLLMNGYATESNTLLMKLLGSTAAASPRPAGAAAGDSKAESKGSGVKNGWATVVVALATLAMLL